METELITEFKKHSIYRLEEGLRMLKKALSFVDQEQFWKIPYKKGMSLGNQLLHVQGNMRQYILSSLGKEPDLRHRDREFEYSPEIDKAQLLSELEATVKASIQCIENTTEAEFLKIRKVQAFSFSGLGAVLHAVEHFSYHVGQTAFWVKSMTAQQLGFYEGVDLNEKNESNAD